MAMSPAIQTSANPAVLAGGDAGAVIQSTDTVSVPPAIVGGDLNITGDLSLSTTGHGIKLKTGTNCKMGQVRLTAGTATVNTTAVRSNSIIFLAHADNIGAATLSVGTITDGVSFVINANTGGDTSLVNWIIFDPA